MNVRCTIATAEAIAIKKALAVQRLTAATERIAVALDVQAVTLPTQGRDPTLIHAAQLEALAAWIESVADALAPADTDTVNYADMTKADLLALADELGLDGLSARDNKDAIVAAVEKATADKQKAADDDNTI